jgi:PEP-CTERM motif
MIGSRVRLAALSIAGAAALAPAVAAPTVYTGEDLAAGSAANMPNSFAARDQFVAQLSGVGTEGFESFASGTEFFANPSAVLDFAGSGVTASLTGGRVVDTPSAGRFPVDGTNYLRTGFNQRITFKSPVDAFGLFVIDANEVDNDPATVTINEQTLTQAQIDARPFDSVDGIFRIITERSPGNFEVLFSGGTFPTDGSALFVGLIDATHPYSNIILINGASGLDEPFLDNFAYDQLTVGTMAELAPIPEPSTWALMALGLAGVAGWARRRRA